MTRVQITSDGAPVVRVLSASGGRPFLAIDHGDEVTVMPIGFEAECSAYARDLAQKLNAAADEVDAKTAAAGK